MEAEDTNCHFNKLFTKSVPHVLEKIFFSLDYASFEKCSVVSVAWNEFLTSKHIQKLEKQLFQEDIERKFWRELKDDNTSEIIKMVSSGMVDVNCEDGNNGQMTPLYRAAYNGNKKVVQILLDKGAEPNVVDQVGWTPLHEAAFRGYKEVAQLLLERGADPNIAIQAEDTALSFAHNRGFKDTANIIRAYGGLDALVIHLNVHCDHACGS